MLLSQTSTDPGNTLLWGFVLIGATIFLIALELVVPSGGVLAIAAAAALIGAVAAFFMHDSTTGMVALAVIAVVGPLAAWIGWKWWSGTVMAERLVLQTDDDTSDSARHCSAVTASPRRTFGQSAPSESMTIGTTPCPISA